MKIDGVYFRPGLHEVKRTDFLQRFSHLWPRLSNEQRETKLIEVHKILCHAHGNRHAAKGRKGSAK